ncbi:RteC domain-containing protein [Salegentibacter salegens]|uniref:RteC protein n=1 Tax=Salegentibacter salegens TaxID=143223 RepID=A0A1M7IKW9_9FLAO|nr:RteC domain-containing protein [Salegentibacter salegens]PRX42487.1 RteC protein [Salegentibacter salegens]SHM41456.1 RteC protein [Salegentibacter salegens]
MKLKNREYNQLQQPALRECPLKAFLGIDINSSFYDFYFEKARGRDFKIDVEVFLRDLYYDILIFINNYEVLPYQVNAYFDATYKRALHYKGVPLKTKEKYHFLLFETIVQQLTGVLAVDKQLPRLPIENSPNLLPGFQFIGAFHQKLRETHIPEKNKIITEFFTSYNPLPEYSPQDTLDFKEAILALDKNKSRDNVTSTIPGNIFLQDHQELGKIRQENNIQWLGTPLELAELVKALIEAKKINGVSEKQVFLFFQQVLDLPFDKREKLQSLRKRSTDLTPLLEEMEFHLKQWINKP